MFHLMRLVQNTSLSGRVCYWLLATSLYFQLSAESHAADKFWNDTSGGNFSTSSNWQSCGFFCNPVAGPNDVAHFGISSPPSPFQFVYTVSFSGNVITNSLLVEDDLVTFDLNAHTYTNSHSPFMVATQIGNVSGRFGQLSVTDGLLDINSVVFVGIAGGIGDLTISQGGRVQSDFFARVGASGSNGAVAVDGSTSQWVHAGELSVGWGGSGIMSVTGGALVQNDRGNIADGASPGTVSVSGTNSRWINTDLFIGNGGTATLNITASGRVQSTTGHVGFVAGHTGAVNIDAGRWINSGDLFLGDLGKGTMNIAGGGEVQNLGAAIGAAAGSTGGVTVSSSTGIASNWLNSGELNIGHSGSGTLDILTGGAVFNTNGFIGRFAGSTGVVNVHGPDANWRNTGNLTVGNNGDGELNINFRAVVESVGGTIGAGAGSTGSVTLTGPFAFWFNSGELTIGRDGDGTLEITDGGLVQNTDGYIGRSIVSGTGAVTVNGAGSTWTNTNFVYVGYDSAGEGSLSVEAGGRVTCTTGFVGNVAGSHGTATVDGPGSTWTTSGTLAVGDGTLTISNGGAVVTNGLFGTLAAENTWDAEVTVVGQGSSWSLAGALLTVGFGGTAAVNILDGGNVVSFDARLAADTGSTGTVHVGGAGSTWTIGRRLGVGGDAGNLVSGGTATLNIQPGGTVNVAQNIVIFAGGLLRLEGGTLDAAAVSFNGGGTFNFLSGTLHAGTYNGSLVNQGGTLAPGHSAGTTTITGSYAQQAAGKLAIEIGGTTPGSTFDVVNIASIAGISGQLQLALLNGFAPSASNTFTVLTAASGLFGTFANVANGQRLATSDGLGSFLVNYGLGSAFNPNNIVLSAFQTAALPGDFNLDGKVDAADYVKWRKGLGTNYTPAHFNIWRAHFGQTAGSTSGASANAAVPEPATFLLLTFGAAGWCLQRRYGLQL